MTKEHYEKKINDCITKAPFESGIEFLVFSLLDEISCNKNISVIDINKCPKDADSRLCTEGGVPDIAVVSDDFRFKMQSKGVVYGLIETKAAGVSIRDTSQITGQCSKTTHYIATNGIVWHYYFKGEQKWEINICTANIPYSITPINIGSQKYNDLIKKLSDIDWLCSFNAS